MQLVVDTVGGLSVLCLNADRVLVTEVWEYGICFRQSNRRHPININYLMWDLVTILFIHIPPY